MATYTYRFCKRIVKEVEPASVAQLVGYDADGNEVYEGDKLVSTKNSDCVCSAYFEPFPEQDDVIKPNHFSNFVLQKNN